MSEFDIEDYKIQTIADPTYDDLEVNVFDFTIHLNSTTALDKRLERDVDFRPLHAYYYDQGVDYARRRFDFTFDPSSGLMVDRKEWLAYYKNDDSLGAEFLIKHRSFNLLDAEEFQASTEEAISLRNDIVGHIKTTISGVVQALNPTFDIEDIINATGPFFQEYTTERLAFVEIGSHSYRDAVALIDLGTTPHTYLAAPVAPGVTLRDYIVSMT